VFEARVRNRLNQFVGHLSPDEVERKRPPAAAGRSRPCRPADEVGEEKDSGGCGSPRRMARSLAGNPFCLAPHGNQRKSPGTTARRPSFATGSLIQRAILTSGPSSSDVRLLGRPIATLVTEVRKSKRDEHGCRQKEGGGRSGWTKKADRDLPGPRRLAPAAGLISPTGHANHERLLGAAKAAD
jgi:hypothetical protein